MKMNQLDSEPDSEFTQQFNKKELQKVLYGQLVPKSSSYDPSNKDREEFLDDTRENIFTYMDRNIAHPDRSYHSRLCVKPLFLGATVQASPG
ncbi:MAG: hypothetical protein Q8Q79_16150 [Sphingopyxis sp.]|nr:hypothetical protein [Sphingopyxis sp.]